MLASFGLQWWQHMIMTGLREHCTQVVICDCIAGKVSGSRNAVLIPSIQFCPSDPTVPFKLCRRRFAIKIAFAVTVNKAEEQTFRRVGIYPLSPVSSMPSSR
jgi:hypothetical protein